jgi:hypothetical protein
MSVFFWFQVAYFYQKKEVSLSCEDVLMSCKAYIFFGIKCISTYQEKND